MRSNLNRRDFLKLSGSVLAGAAMSKFTGLASYDGFARVSSSSVKKPNILLVVMDAARAQSMSLYGYSRPTTPNFEKLAERGVVFQNAVPTASWTLPSHASMFTSLYPSAMGTDYYVPLGSSFPTISEYLRDQEYQTAGFVGNNFYCSYEYGLSRGFEHYEDYKKSVWQTMVSSASLSSVIDKTELYKRIRNSPFFDLKHAAEINQDFLRWLGHRKTQRPFFAFINYMDAHDPYVPPIPYATSFSDQLPDGYLDDPGRQVRDPHTVRELNDAYDGSLLYLDDRITDLVDDLDRSGISEDTLILITSDHGEHFGEHNLLGHGNSLYLSLLSVPLICIYPKSIPAGVSVSNRISLRELPATLVSMLNQPIPDYFHGASLERFWKGESYPLDEDMIFSEILTPYGDEIPRENSMKSVLYKDMHYIRNKNAPDELYLLSDDPEEVNNLAQTPQGASTASYFRQRLEDFKKGY